MVIDEEAKLGRAAGLQADHGGEIVEVRRECVAPVGRRNALRPLTWNPPPCLELHIG